MADLKRRVAESGSALGRRGEKRDKAITTHKKSVDSTYSVNPTPMRLTLSDLSDLDDWCEDLQENMKKKVTRAKVFRGLIAIKDDLPVSVKNKLIEAIKEL